VTQSQQDVQQAQQLQLTLQTNGGQLGAGNPAEVRPAWLPSVDPITVTDRQSDSTTLCSAACRRMRARSDAALCIARKAQEATNTDKLPLVAGSAAAPVELRPVPVRGTLNASAPIRR
jgi:hypothetical protein